MIIIKINVEKIDKKRLYKGQKGTYLSAVLIPTPNGKEDFMIVEEVSKEEREKGIKGTIIGNGKEYKSKQEPVKTDKESLQDNNPDDLPF